jgi:spore coat polysaccharide biosynthesis protein SpsF
MKVVAIVQARLGSSRLPGKVLKDLEGKPVLERCLDRLGRAASLDQVVVATTELEQDQVLADWCARAGWPVCRGSAEDLLDRYHQAAELFGARTVVRVTSDCPAIDPELVDRAVGEFLERPGLDYASTRLPANTYPVGLDTEVMSRQALERAWREDRNPAWREHVTPYLYFHPERFSLHGVAGEEDCSGFRLTVDTPEDLELMRLIYRHFGHDRFTWSQAVELLRQRPDWAAINAQVVQKTILVD